MSRTLEWYQIHLAEWHRWRFHTMMGSLGGVRRVQRSITQLALNQYVKGDQKDALWAADILKKGVSLNEEWDRMIDCWEVDRDLAYEQFGERFDFPPPNPKIKKGGAA